MKIYFYLNGKILPIDKPAVQINDIGILRGYAVFDFMRTYNGQIFHWDDHFKRFVDSAKILGLKIPFKKEEILKSINVLLKKNKCQEASLRLVLTGGPTDDGMTYKKPNFAILVEDIYNFPKKSYQKGVKLISSEHQRVLPKSKNNNYIWAIKMQATKKKKGAMEILYTSQGKILEASTSNFFIIKGATLITPKNDILKGITRRVVLRLARKFFRVEEREVDITELESATESFITSTNKMIMPVVKIDDKNIGDGQVGKNTKLLMEEYQKYIDKN